MRKIVPTQLEACRLRTGPYGTDFSYGLTGAWFIPFRGRELKVVSSDGSDWDTCNLEGEPWEHVSVSLPNRTPNWAEMCYVKSLFFTDEETVLQFHVPRAKHVNYHEFCLHLWRPLRTEIPLPPEITVGPLS